MKKFTENIYILEKLGQGGMGEVFKAKIVKPEQGFEKVVALKVLPEYTPQAEKKKEALLKEARIVANLNHPNINQVFDVGEVEGTPYVVMDLVEGHDLREIIKTAKEKNIFLSTSNAIEIVLSLLDALEYAHSLTSPIIHRDISPHNVMVTNQGTVKLLDFGLSKIQENTDQSKTEGYIGKYSYLPLEVIEGKTYKAEHDVYAVGLILYELLTLEKVYGGNLELEIIGKIKDGHIESAMTFNPKIPKGLDELLKDWIHPKEAKRIKDILEIRKNLLLVRKELVSTSSLKEEVLGVLNENTTLFKTIIDKNRKVSFQNKRIITLKLLSIASVIVVISSMIVFGMYSTKRSEPFIRLSIDDVIYDISPKEKEFDDISDVEQTSLYLKSFCNYYCSASYIATSMFLNPNNAAFVDHHSKDVMDIYEKFLLTLKTPNSVRFNNGCSYIEFCNTLFETQKILMINNTPTSKNISFKEITKNNLDLLKRTKLAEKWLRINANEKDYFQLYRKGRDQLETSYTVNTEHLIKYDLIYLSDRFFPLDAQGCKSSALLLSHEHYYTNYNNKKLIIIPITSRIRIDGFKNKDTVIFKLQKEVVQNDSLFKHGLCFVQFKDSMISKTRFWVPKTPL